MLRFALPVTLRQELFILSSGHHLRRTPRLAAIKLFLKLLRSLTARPAMLLPNAPSKSLFRCSYCNRRRAAREPIAKFRSRAKYRASSLT